MAPGFRRGVRIFDSDLSFRQFFRTGKVDSPVRHQVPTNCRRGSRLRRAQLPCREESHGPFGPRCLT